jgi:hypothetical protein
VCFFELHVSDAKLWLWTNQIVALRQLKLWLSGNARGKLSNSLKALLTTRRSHDLG